MSPEPGKGSEGLGCTQAGEGPLKVRSKRKPSLSSGSRGWVASGCSPRSLCSPCFLQFPQLLSLPRVSAFHSGRWEDLCPRPPVRMQVAILLCGRAGAGAEQEPRSSSDSGRSAQ